MYGGRIAHSTDQGGSLAWLGAPAQMACMLGDMHACQHVRTQGQHAARKLRACVCGTCPGTQLPNKPLQNMNKCDEMHNHCAIFAPDGTYQESDLMEFPTDMGGLF